MRGQRRCLKSVKRNDTPLKRNDTPLKRNDTPLKRNDTPLKRNDTPLKERDTPWGGSRSVFRGGAGRGAPGVVSEESGK
jgi:hypothetical protein